MNRILWGSLGLILKHFSLSVWLLLKTLLFNFKPYICWSLFDCLQTTLLLRFFWLLWDHFKAVIHPKRWLFSKDRLTLRLLLYFYFKWLAVSLGLFLGLLLGYTKGVSLAKARWILSEAAGLGNRVMISKWRLFVELTSRLDIVIVERPSGFLLVFTETKITLQFDALFLNFNWCSLYSKFVIATETTLALKIVL